MEKLKNRFLKYVNKSNKCWNWVGCVSQDGYGGFLIGHKKVLAHRVSYQIYVAEIPKGLCVLHKCDNPACVNPKHLFLGSHLDNMKDKIKKGRQPRGENNIKAKLSQKDVDEIRSLYQKKLYYQRELAEQFGVSKGAVWAILNQKSWKTS